MCIHGAPARSPSWVRVPGEQILIPIASIGQCSVRRRIPSNVTYSASRALNAAGLMPPRDNEDDKEEELDKMKMEPSKVQKGIVHHVHVVCCCCDSCKHIWLLVAMKCVSCST